MIFIGKSTTATRRNRDIIPKSRARSDTSSETTATPAAKKSKISVDSNTVPSKTWVIEQQKHVHYPLALRSIAIAVSVTITNDVEIVVKLIDSFAQVN